jgi:hypothetical protein
MVANDGRARARREGLILIEGAAVLLDQPEVSS